MPAQSKAQQKFMGMVHAAQKGEMKPKGAVAKAAKSMSKKAATDFASTKHKGLPGHVKEGIENGESIPFTYVLRPTSHEDNANDLVVRTHIVNFAKNHPEFENIYGYYLDNSEAEAVATDLLKGLHEQASMLEEKKSKVTDALQKKIDELQKHAEEHLKMAKKDPEHAEKHHDQAEQLLARIKVLRKKHKVVESSKKEVKPLEEARFKKGEDIGKPGKGFAKVAKAASKEYGSKEAGQKVAGAILKKVINKK